MCGITGFWEEPGRDRCSLHSCVQSMADTLVHRGPDAAGVMIDETVGLAFGFRRLAIIDLTAQGHQPMRSESGRYTIVFNGEVYNFRELRAELASCGHLFRGHSDTEVMLAAIEEWGLERATRRFVGMFAFAVWDEEERTVALVRDRLGIKPLYYGWSETAFFFASELKALSNYAGFKSEVDRGALALYLRHSYVPTPYSIYAGVFKLSPGCILTVRGRRERAGPVPFWSLRDIVETGCGSPRGTSDEEALEEFGRLLGEAVRMRMVADVPVGAFLSGGIDSSSVVALMQAHSSRPVKTFSIGFREDDFDEAQHARAVAGHLGTDHTELYVTPGAAQAVVPRMAETYDEPFADPSQIPTFLVSTLARREVTVSLSGDGGDELLAGYDRYFLANAIWARTRRVPPPVRHGISRAAASVADHAPDAWVQVLKPLTSRYSAIPARHRMRKAAELVGTAGREQLYRAITSYWRDPASIVVGGGEPLEIASDPACWPKSDDYFTHMQYLDCMTYLPDDILTKVDRASMAVSLEARVPLLDHRVVEHVWSLPFHFKVRAGQSKWILRQLLYQHVPPSLIDRPKMGFGIPIEHWLRGALRDWAEHLLDERRIRDQGFLQPEPIRRRWAEHLSGSYNWQYHLWSVLMFQCWLERWRP